MALPVETVVEFKDGFLHPRLGLVLIWRYRAVHMTDWQYAYVKKPVAWDDRQFAAFRRQVLDEGLNAALDAFRLR